MKIKLLILSLFSIFFINAQVSVGPKHYGKPSKFKKGYLEKFKNSKTIFVLSNIYDVETYKELLQDIWTVTPYEVIPESEYDVRKYAKDDFSVFIMKGYRVDKTTKMGSRVSYLYMFIELMMFEEGLIEELQKYEGKKLERKFKGIVSDHEESLARIDLQPTDVMIAKALKLEEDEIVEALFNDKGFYNYSLGYLKNYFQKVNDQLAKEEIYWMYEDSHTAELTNLADQKLYIPDYLKISYDPVKLTDNEMSNEEVEKLFSNYDYEYEFIATEDLSQKIMNNEEFYYFRYGRINAQKFFHIVNSKTGEIIYRNYETGFVYNLKPKHLKELNSDIAKAVKKQSKNK